jgi:hypothetical protein
LFTVAGTAEYQGTTKARFANDLKARIKMLERAGMTEIALVELPNPMTKAEAITYLKANKPEGVDLSALDEKEAAIVAQAKPKEHKDPKVKTPKAERPSKEPQAKEDPVSSIVSTIVNSARKGKSIRAKAQNAAAAQAVAEAATK